MPIYDLNYKNAQPTIGSDNRQSTINLNAETRQRFICLNSKL